MFFLLQDYPLRSPQVRNIYDNACQAVTRRAISPFKIFVFESSDFKIFFHSLRQNRKALKLTAAGNQG